MSARLRVDGHFDPEERRAEKQASRDEDQRRLDAGEISMAELARENDFFREVDWKKFRIAAIGGEPIRRR